MYITLRNKRKIKQDGKYEYLMPPSPPNSYIVMAESLLLKICLGLTLVGLLGFGGLLPCLGILCVGDPLWRCLSVKGFLYAFITLNGIMLLG